MNIPTAIVLSVGILVVGAAVIVWMVFRRIDRMMR
jgi:hypothetical protein